MSRIQIPAFNIVQNNKEMLVFCCPVSTIYERFDVSRRIEDKILGYQRSFSTSRIKQIKSYINQEQGIIPNSILVNLDNETYDYQQNSLYLNENGSLGLIIDGQHRVKGAYEANPDFQLMVVATLGLTVRGQAELFVKINKTQKGVPASLYLDLMSLLEGDISDFDQEGVSAERRATEIALRLNELDESPLYQLIRRTGDSGFGISLSQFVSQIKPYIEPEKGRIAHYGFEEQCKIFTIYFRAIKAVFLDQWENPDSYILKTVAFGGIMKAFYEIFSLVLQKYQVFNTDNTIKIIQTINDFKFDRNNLPSGGGFKAQEKFGDILVNQVKNAIRESQSFVATIGD